MAFERYELTTSGTVPVTLTVAKSYLRIPETVEVDDDLVTLFLVSAADFAEQYTRRELRANTWTLFLDEFPVRIPLFRDPVDTITSVKYLNDADTPDIITVAASVYYLKNNVQASEVLLLPDQEWPVDVNEQEGTVEIEFVTEAHRNLDQMKNGILRHVAFLYENRGDCDPGKGDAAKLSGATDLYDQIRVVRV